MIDRLIPGENALRDVEKSLNQILSGGAPLPVSVATSVNILA